MALPALTLELNSESELESAWSGALHPSVWRGNLGNGHDLTIGWGRGGDLLFSCPGTARFHLSPNATRLRCEAGDVSGIDWLRILLSRVLPIVSLAHGREALHASAVRTPAGVLAIAAASGEGKSTMARELGHRGSPVFADDVLILDRGPEGIEAHPSSPYMSLAADTFESWQTEEFGDLVGVFGAEKWVTLRDFSTESSPVAAIVLLERGAGLAVESEPQPCNPLVLAPFMLGLPDEEGHDADRFAIYSDLVESTLLLRVRGDLATRPSRFAQLIEEAVHCGLETSVGRAA